MLSLCHKCGTHMPVIFLRPPVGRVLLKCQLYVTHSTCVGDKRE